MQPHCAGAQLAARAMLFLPAALGFAIALYFTGVSHRWWRPDAGAVPRFCRLGADTCGRLLYTPEARLFGVPNSVLGLAYYVAVLGVAILGPGPAGSSSAPLLPAMRVVAWGTVALGIYLTGRLVFALRVRCRLCLIAHGVNAILAVVLTWCWDGSR